MGKTLFIILAIANSIKTSDDKKKLSEKTSQYKNKLAKKVKNLKKELEALEAEELTITTDFQEKIPDELLAIIINNFKK